MIWEFPEIITPFFLHESGNKLLMSFKMIGQQHSSEMCVNKSHIADTDILVSNFILETHVGKIPKHEFA